MKLVLFEKFTRKPMKPKPRAFTRRSVFWEETVPAFNDRLFVKYFRVSRNMFNLIHDEIQILIQKKDTPMRPTIKTDKKLAITLFRLAKGGSADQVSELFGIGESTTNLIVGDVCRAIVTEFFDVVVKLPETQGDFEKSTAIFNDRGMFNCFGALDGCHIPIRPPPYHNKPYFNYKNFYSFILLALVSADYKFTYVSIGCPGSYHDANVFRRTKFYKALQAGQILPDYCADVDGVMVPFYIIADDAFPLHPWLMKNYSATVLNTKQKYFNSILSSSRQVVENAFGKLKNRFRILQCASSICLETHILVTKTCVALHNLCQTLQVPFEPEHWNFPDEIGPLFGTELINWGAVLNHIDSISKNIRDALTEHIITKQVSLINIT